MNLPPLQSPISASYHASGDVAIATDAVIAPGVVLMSDPSAQIIVGSGACLGLGVVLHANQGAIVIEAGASLGAGVLVVGSCRIGTQACIGASTTLHNASVPPGQLVAPGSLLGQAGRMHSPPSAGSSSNGASPSPWDECSEEESLKSETAAKEAPEKAPKMEEANENGRGPNREKNSYGSGGDPPAGGAGVKDPAAAQPPPPPRKPAKVYGKAQFERMRVMFRPD